MELIIIAAIDEAQGLGKNNKLAWNYPQDLQRFRSLTTHHTIVMGRRTWDSLPKALSGRRNIVITRDPAREFHRYYSGDTNHELHPVEFYDSIIEKNIYESTFQLSDKIFFIGGGEIYREVIDFVDTILLTRVPGNYGCDAFFPNIPIGFKLTKVEENPPLKYETYQR